MTAIDVAWFRACHAAGLVSGKLLEIGAAKIDGGENLCEVAARLGVAETTGADLEKYPGVDITCDFGVNADEFRKNWVSGRFATVCVFNVLEHTFDPLIVLSNALTCLEDRGTLLVVTPSIWPIHNYPRDFNRLLPDWYREFARRNSIELPAELFCWLSQFGIEAIAGAGDLPNYVTRRAKSSVRRYWISRIGHKLLNTYGRSHWATHSAIGAAFVRP